MSDIWFTDHKWAQEIESGVLNYLEALINQDDDYNDSVEPEHPVETESGQPFCHCETCFWREALTYLIPRIIDGYQRGIVGVGPTLADDEEA
jgi:hypothetical protein